MTSGVIRATSAGQVRGFVGQRVGIDPLFIFSSFDRGNIYSASQVFGRARHRFRAGTEILPD